MLEEELRASIEQLSGGTLMPHGLESCGSRLSQGPGRLVSSGALPGTAAVALLLFGTRWASYLGYSPIFLTDLLICGGVTLLLCGWRGTGPSPPRATHFPGLAVSLFLGFVLMRSPWPGDLFTQTWARDLAPFLYSSLAFVGAAAYARSDAVSRRRTETIFTVALIGHLTWSLLISYNIILNANLPSVPGSNVSFLSIRTDVDMVMLGVLAGLMLRRLVLGKGNLSSALCLGLIGLSLTRSDFSSRAGLIAMTICLAIAFITSVNHITRASRQLLWLSAIPVVFLMGALWLYRSPAGERLLATLGLQVSSDAAASALGTEEARRIAWQQVIDWTFENPVRALVGSGFGNDFLLDSGAVQILAGTDWTGVRSPHNWVVGNLARLGTVGAILTLLVVVILIAKIVMLSNEIGKSELLLVAAMTTISLVLTSFIGVVLESPFGAVPFWWFYGILMSAPSRNSSWSSLTLWKISSRIRGTGVGAP